MKVGRILLVGALLATCTASAALAGVMATAPAQQDYPTTQVLYCDIVNLNTEPKLVTVEAMDLNGIVVSGPAGPFPLAPNEGTALYSGTGGAWCSFTVEGSAKKYRGVAVYDDGAGYTLSIPAQ